MGKAVHVDELRKIMRERLLRMLKTHPLKNSTSVGLGFWMAEHLDEDDLESFLAIENALGEDKANRWLVSVLVESGQYSSDDNVHVTKN